MSDDLRERVARAMVNRAFGPEYTWDTVSEIVREEALLDADAALAEIGGVRVKPLDWRIGCHKSDYGDHIAQSLLGEYSVREVDGRGFTLWFRERCLGDKPHGVREKFNTLEAAKAAANEHCRARILAAIEPAPVSVREAARVLLNHLPADMNHPAYDALTEKAEEGADEDDCIRAFLQAFTGDKANGPN